MFIIVSAEVGLTFRIKIRDYLLYCMQTVLYCSVDDATDVVYSDVLTISCITCNFCAINIINRKKVGEMLWLGIPTSSQWAFSALYFS